ncbi:MAG: sulfatase [bacterium]
MAKVISKKRNYKGLEYFFWIVVAALLICGIIKYQQTRPVNILLVTVDTLRANYLGCYGNQKIQTPNIDQLATFGILCNTAVCEMPTTSPSHASILTSLEPRVHGVLTNSWTIRTTITTIPEILKANGYTTAGFVSAFHLGKTLGFAQGFDTFDDKFQGLQRNATQVTDATLTWLKGNQNKPWFIWLHYFDAHTPYEPPAQFANRYPAANNDSKIYASFSQLSAMEEHKYSPTEKDIDHMKALYSGEISYIDAEFGRLMAYLRQQGLLNNTIIVLVADHGECFDHGIYANHDQSLYDTAIRVPLLFAGPKSIIPQGKQIKTLVRTIDIVPTILAITKIKSDTFIQGKNLLPLMQGINSATSGYAVIERRYYQNQEDCIRRHIPVGERYAVRSDKWKYISSEFAPPELYDLEKDPDELNNLDKDNPKQKADMQQYLDKWLADNNKLRTWAYQKIDAETAEQLRSLGYIGN